MNAVTASPSTRTTWKIDPAHTAVEFAVKHMVITTVKGRFAGVIGTIVLDDADPSRSSVVAEIDAASIDTRQAQRDAHLRSPDFLDVESYPTLTFRGTSVTPVGDDRAIVAGDLTIRGVTRQVELDVELLGRGTDPWGGARAGFSATTRIDRKDYGLTWNQALETGGLLVGDEIKITLEVQAIRQDA